VPEALTPANVRTIINVEDGADVTDTTNVTAAGALMDSEVDADLKTFSLPANTTISTFGASIIDDADEATFKATVNLEIGTDVQAYNANLNTISGLTPSNDDILQRKSGAWTNRTPAQVKTDLSLTATDVGLANVDNLSIRSATALADVRSRSFFLPSPADTDDLPIIRFDTATTLTKVVYAISGGTNWVGQLQEANDAQGTGAADTQASDSTVTGTTTVTSFSNASFDAGDYVRLKTTSVSGEVAWLHVTFYFTINS
jgi:hypothetical protein